METSRKHIKLLFAVPSKESRCTNCSGKFTIRITLPNGVLACLKLQWAITSPGERESHSPSFYNGEQAKYAIITAGSRNLEPAKCCSGSTLCPIGSSATTARISRADSAHSSRCRSCCCCFWCSHISTKKQGIPNSEKAIGGHSSLCLFCRHPCPIPHRTIRRWTHLRLFRDMVGAVVENLKQQQQQPPSQREQYTI